MKCFLFHTAIGLFLSANLVSCAPGALQPRDERWTTRKAPHGSHSLPHSNTNLTISPWPNDHYFLPLINDYKLNIYSATPYSRRPPPRVLLLQEFIRDFADNIEHAYPPPALAPIRGGQRYYDMDSFTKWRIEEAVLPIMGTSASTELVMLALAQISLQVASHGPPAELNTLIVGQKKPGKYYPMNSIYLSVHPLGEGEMRGTAVSRTGGFVSTS